MKTGTIEDVNGDNDPMPVELSNKPAKPELPKRLDQRLIPQARTISRMDKANPNESDTKLRDKLRAKHIVSRKRRGA